MGRKSGQFVANFLTFCGKRILRFWRPNSFPSDLQQEKAMTLTLLLISGISLGIVAVSVMITRSYAVPSPALAGESTAVGLADHATDTLPTDTVLGPGGTGFPVENDWQLTTVSALCDAEDLLDCLESQGYSQRELHILSNSCFAVRWR
jgi:hypothetical protein